MAESTTFSIKTRKAAKITWCKRDFTPEPVTVKSPGDLSAAQLASCRRHGGLVVMDGSAKSAK